MSLAWTLAGLAVSALVFALATWRAQRPYQPGLPALVPAGAVQFVALVLLIGLLAHLLALLTGRPVGRF